MKIYNINLQNYIIRNTEKNTSKKHIDGVLNQPYYFRQLDTPTMYSIKD